MQAETNFIRKHSSFIDNFYHICVGLFPTLYIVNVPGLNMSLGTILLFLLLPQSFIYIIKRKKFKGRISTLCFFAFYFYLIARCEGNLTRIVICCCTFIIIAGQINGAIDTLKIRKVIETFAIVNVVLVMIQVVSYYLLHIQIQYIPKWLIYEEYQNSWVFRDFTGLYRPSALFLEPSHFAQYCVFALISALFPTVEKVNLKKALVIGAGVILTTSGQGILLTVGVAAWYLAFNNQSLNKKIINILRIVPVILIVVAVLYNTEFFQAAINRIFNRVDGYTAIEGRTHNWDDAIGNMHGKTLWFGYGDSHKFRLYLPGLADTIYKYGLLCIILESLCLLYLMLKKIGNNYIWCSCVVFTILFCIAHVTNYVSQIFYFGIIIAEATTVQIRGEGQMYPINVFPPKIG